MSVVKTADSWTVKVEKSKIEEFYKKFFNRKIDWPKVTLPAKNGAMQRLEYIFENISADEALEAYYEKFGNDCLWKYYISSIDEVVKEEQFRPAGDYLFWHVGGDEPDVLKLDFINGVSAGIKFMIPVEGIVAAFRHRVETGKMYDVKGSTHFAVLDLNDRDLCMGIDIFGRFFIAGDADKLAYRKDDGIRQVSF